ncbi:MAG: tetratricopeptide repeat-containing protein [Acidimicrobiia bacterium]
MSSVVDAERRGELLLAFDLVERALVEFPGDVELQFRAVLALARSGSTGEAARRFDEYELGIVKDEDTQALSARLKKDAALVADGDEGQRLALQAALEYRMIYEQTGGYFPAVNAATLSFLAGDRDGGVALAGDALRAVVASHDDSYYALATEAEAHLLRGEVESARSALERAARANKGDYGALATTRRQLRMICQTAGIDTEVLAAVAGPAVVHFCGHRIDVDDRGPFRSTDERHVGGLIVDVVARHNVGFAYGSLASGGDILWAEALLARGVELHIVLPFALEEFVECSVAPSGHSWVERFSQCLDRAASVTYGTSDAFLGDDVLYRYCSEIAMGLTLVRARWLDAEVHQFALWDGKPARGEAGTAIDVALWQSTGHPVTIVRPPTVDGPPIITDSGQRSVPGPTVARHDRAVEAGSGRVIRAMLFADVRGFSKLTDEQLPTFAQYVFGSFAEVLDRYRTVVEYSNTWGDALYAVITDAVSAAACALDLQHAIEHLAPETVGLPADLALRLGGHVGPIFPVADLILKRRSFVGSHVNRTARIEPVTPPGAVYVTSPFAAALELTDGHPFACDYVGHRPAAKDYGSLRMYRLRLANTTPADLSGGGRAGTPVS